MSLAHDKMYKQMVDEFIDQSYFNRNTFDMAENGTNVHKYLMQYKNEKLPVAPPWLKNAKHDIEGSFIE